MICGHQRRLFAVYHRKKAWQRLAPQARGPCINQKLGKHQKRVGGGFLCLEPYFGGLNIDKALEDVFQAKRLDIGVFDVFFGFGAVKMLQQTQWLNPFCRDMRGMRGGTFGKTALGHIFDLARQRLGPRGNFGQVIGQIGGHFSCDRR